jgi:FkbM family methyltransferase
VKTISRTQFDSNYYLDLIEARGDTICRMVNQLKPALNLSTALDAGCGVGFFGKILQDAGLSVRAFDGRIENVEEARSRFPQVSFERGNVENPDIRKLGQFDLVLCFGLLYHLENPFLAIRNLYALTGKCLLLESMCFPGEDPWMLLREEPNREDQSLTDVAFYPTEGGLVKMLYRAGFTWVYRVSTLPDHDDFRETLEHERRRTVLVVSKIALQLPELTPVPEPREKNDPWAKRRANSSALAYRARKFLSKPASAKYAAFARRVRRIFPRIRIPLRLPFGAWWIAGSGAIDRELLTNGFENAELTLVEKLLQTGMTVLDIGAHHGLYTLLASKRVGSTGKVVAFEPSARERTRLLRHLRLNNSHNVTLEPMALGSEAGEADFFLVDYFEDACNSLRPPTVHSTTHRVRVPVFRLDDVLEKLGVRTVDFMKLDVEGAERDVLAGAPRLLTSSPRPLILVEVSDLRTSPWGYDAREILQSLVQLGFETFTFSPKGTIRPISAELCSYDSNVLAIPSERSEETLKHLVGR